MAASSKTSLSTTAYAVLGLLSFGETSGYDLKKKFELTVGHFMTPAKSQIYAELKKLGTLGFTSSKVVKQQDRPDKRIYRITDKGRGVFTEWLESDEVEPETFRSPFLVKVFFGEHMDSQILISQIKKYREEAVESLASLKLLEKNLAGNPFFFYPFLTLKSGLIHCSAQVKWADDVIKQLEDRGR